MGSYLLRRLLLAPLVLFVLATVTFVMVRTAPGGPFQGERGMDPVVQRALDAEYHLDRPMWRQYLDFLGNVAVGDLGPSYKHKAETVNEIVARELPVSLLLGGLALLVSLLIGIPVGVLGATHPDKFGDRSAMVVALVAISLPTFVIGPLLAFGFGFDTAAYLFVALLTCAAFLEAAFGLCLGCKTFALLMRIGWIPESVCLDCADITRRHPDLSTTTR